MQEDDRPRRRSVAHVNSVSPDGSPRVVNHLDSISINYNRETTLVVKHATPYVSKRVRQFILRRLGVAGGVLTPEADTVSAFVLIADISGYTKLTTSLTEQIDGGHGAFALNVAVNRIFGSITTMIEAYGGDVVKFVGDAVIAAWYLEHSSDEHAAQAAAHAAVSAAMLMLSQPLVSPAPGHSMSLHCAIDFGVLSELLVGGVDNRWQHVISGPIFGSLNRILSAAGPGQLCISEQIWERLKQHDGVASRVDSSPAETSAVFLVESVRYHELSKVDKWAASIDMPMPQDIEQQIMLFLPHPPKEALRTGTEMWLAENRWVACVFFNFHQLEAHTAMVAQEVVATIQALIQKHEGDLHQLVCDEKGTTAIGMWGTPPHSHPDDPLFAARCAVEVARLVGPLLQAAGLGSLHAGISVGRAFCGNIGSVSRCEYCLVGDVMNMSARLAAAAGKLNEAVICDEHCAQFISDAGDRAMVAELRAHELSLKNVARVVVASVLGQAAHPTPGSVRSFSRMRWAMGSTRSLGGASVGDLASLDEGSERGGAGAAADDRCSERSGNLAPAAAGRHSSQGNPQQRPQQQQQQQHQRISTHPHFGGIFGLDCFRNRSPVLYGREEALSEVARLIAESNAGPAGGGGLLITVTGAMSMGKTSFLKVAALAAVRDMPDQCCLFLAPGRAGSDTETPFHSWRIGWFRDMCERHGQHVPERLRVFLPLLDDIFRGGPGGRPAGAGIARMEIHSQNGSSEGVGPSGDSFSTGIGESGAHPLRRSSAGLSTRSVADTAVSDSGECIRALSPEERVRMTVAVATEIVAIEADMARLPILIIADDAHFMDAISWKLLLSVQAAIRPSIILSFWRQEIPALRHLKANSVMNRRCRLGPLVAGDLRKVVANTLGVTEQAVPADLLDIIVSMSAGHPMLAKEVVVMLVREGKVKADPVADTCTVVGDKGDIANGSLAPGAAPYARLQLLVQHRLDGFGMAARSALRVAAAIRGKFALGFLRRCCAEVTSEAEAQLIASELLEEGVWTMIPETPIHYQFSHDLLRSLVYQSIPPDQRRQIHAAILHDLEHGQELLYGDAGTARLAEKARHAREAHEHVKATSYYLACARAGASFLSHGRWGLNDALKSAREGLRTLNLAQQPDGPASSGISQQGMFNVGAAPEGGRPADVSLTGESEGSSSQDMSERQGKPERSRSSLGGAVAAGWGESPRASMGRVVHISDDARSVSGPRRVRTASSRRSSVGKPSEQISCPLDDNDFEREREHELGETSSDEFFDESTVFADVSTLQAELQTVLDDVERVQNSWLVLEKDRPRHGLVMMRRFFEIAPAALRVFSFGKEATEDPTWDIAKDKRLASHAVIIISTVGSVVAGLKDFSSMAQTIRKVGNMHHRHKGAREFFGPMGEALLFTVQAALGSSFTHAVGEAWMSVYEVVKMHMLAAMDEMEAQERERASLKASLLGDLSLDF